MFKLAVKKLDPRARAPEVAHPGEDLGFDLFALERVVLHPGMPTKVRTGIAVSVYEVQEIVVTRGYTDSEVARYETGKRTPMGLIIKDRSSMAAKGIRTSGGVIDAGYRGEIAVILTSTSMYTAEAGDKIAQMVPVHVLTGVVEETDELSEASRGEAGFGSSGK